MINQLLQGDCLEQLKTLPDCSVDAVVTDPPYGLGQVRDLPGLIGAWLRGEDDSQYHTRGFMGKQWDVVPHPGYWRECYRVLKPGGHLLAFAGTRTQDLMGLSIRLAGFELRDTIEHLNGSNIPLWLYGSGFPKSLDIGKGIDRQAGKEREVVGFSSNHRTLKLTEVYCGQPHTKNGEITAPATPEATTWDGWGTALKPSQEPILMFRKPLERGLSVAANVLKWGVAGINVAACRVGEDTVKTQGKRNGTGISLNWNKYNSPKNYEGAVNTGRWPANLVLTHTLFCDENGCAEGCPVAVMDGQSGVLKSGNTLDYKERRRKGFMLSGSENNVQKANAPDSYGDTVGASRFFPQFRYTPEDYTWLFRYEAKASASERNEGLEHFAPKTKIYNGKSAESSKDIKPVEERFTTEARNIHPTVKPLELMRWLVRLVCPHGGTVLDPFGGSGTTGIAAYLEDCGYILIEREAEYVEIARARLDWHQRQLKLEMVV